MCNLKLRKHECSSLRSGGSGSGADQDWGVAGGFLKNDSNQHSDLRWHENQSLGLTSAWKPVFRADISMEVGFRAVVGQNADWNNL